MKNAAIVALSILILPMASARSAETSAPRFTLKLAAGIGFPGMSKPMTPPLYISTGSLTAGVDDYYQNYSGSLAYRIGSGVSIGLGYEFLRARGQGVQVGYRGLSTDPFVIDFLTHGAYGLVDKNWPLLKKPFKVEVHAGVQAGRYWSSPQYTFAAYDDYILVGYSVRVPETWRSWRAGSWGVEPMGGFSWLAIRHFSVGIEGGYRWLRGEIPASPVPKTDFTGPTVRLSLSTRF